MRAVLLAVALAGVASLAWAPASSAATYVNPCVAADPVCERLEAVVVALEALPQTDTEHDYAAVLAAIQTNTASTGTPAEVAGTVELGPLALERIDRELEIAGVTLGLIAGIFGIYFVRNLFKGRES